MIIKSFIGKAIARLQADLNVVGAPVFLVGPTTVPAANELPRVVASAGPLEMLGAFGDAPAGQVRPRTFRETPFPINLGNVEGPYALSQQPLDGTVSCNLAWKQAGDALEGKKIRLYPRKGNSGDGFTVDYANSMIRVFHAAPLTGTPTLEVEYSYAATYSIREFQQRMVLASYAATPADAEKWAALAASVLVSNTPSLLSAANSSGNLHSGGNYVTEHLISEFNLAEGALERVGNGIFCYTLQFDTRGQVILMRTVNDGFNVIQKIYSPGHRGDAGPVAIEPNVG